MAEFIELGAHDGHRFKAWRSLPEGQAKGSIIIAPEIFGVNKHIRAVADGYAADGYSVLAPALFDRVEREFEAGYEQADVAAGIAIMGEIDFDASLRDIDACIKHFDGNTKPALIGYCWGGTIAWLAAARLEGLACSVAYYGGGIPDYADERANCPTMLHFGKQDTRPTYEQAQAIAEANPALTCHFHDAGHGFNCNLRASYNELASREARALTVGFIDQHNG